MTDEPHGEHPRREFDRGEPRYEPILEQLGFEITPELIEITAALRIALIDGTEPEALRALWVEYGRQMEELINGVEDIGFSLARAHIGAIAHKAFLFRDAGNTLRYLEELTGAQIYASDVVYDDDNPEVPKNAALYALSKVLLAEIKGKTTRLEPSTERFILQLTDKIGGGDLLKLWELWAEEQDTQDLIDRAYEMLLDAAEGTEEDPEEYAMNTLRELGAIE